MCHHKYREQDPQVHNGTREAGTPKYKHGDLVGILSQRQERYAKAAGRVKYNLHQVYLSGWRRFGLLKRNFWPIYVDN